MELFAQIKLPEAAEFILEKLNENGFEAYIVGGCVRDSIMGRKPYDWDITTNAKPHEIKALFEKSIDTGIKHGIVTIAVNNSSYEVATFRTDGEYLDYRRPENIEFADTLSEDLLRRDFTMNAIAYSPLQGFVDPFDGMRDISEGIIRAVGSPDERFNEDALRMLRAVRFSAQLGFSIHTDTLCAIRKNSGLIGSISRERIREELTKILLSPNPGSFRLLHGTGLLIHILPEFEACFNTTQNHPYHVFNVAEHSLKAVSSIESQVDLRWAMLLHDIGKPVTKTTDENGIDHFYGHTQKSVELAERILRRLRFDNKTIEKILRLIKFHDRIMVAKDKPVRKAVREIGSDIFEDLIKVQLADSSAQNPEFFKERSIKLRRVMDLYQEMLEASHCTSLADLAVNGNDLIEQLGLKPGREIGTILERLLDAVIEDPGLNIREKLLEKAKQIQSHF